MNLYHSIIKERDINQNYLKLTEYLSEFNDLSNTKLLSDKFNSLASHLLNNTCLVVSNNPYRIIELEIYYFDENNHPDPYVHKANEQLALGNWYFNGFGLDITFGNAENKIYGGILIRGIKSLGKTPKYISGPSNVLKEIFSRMGNVMSVNSGIYLTELIPINQNESNKDSNQDENYKGIIQSTRIGLPKKLEDTNNFAERQYRYLIDLNIHHKFKDKEKVVRQLYANNKLTEDQAKRIMGYNLGL